MPGHDVIRTNHLGPREHPIDVEADGVALVLPVGRQVRPAGCFGHGQALTSNNFVVKSVKPGGACIG